MPLAFVWEIYQWLVDSPSQRASNAENVSTWLHYHAFVTSKYAIWFTHSRGAYSSA